MPTKRKILDTSDKIRMNTEKVPLSQRDFALDQPIDWDIFDPKGRLLVKKGMKLKTQNQIARLLELGALRIEEITEEEVQETEFIDVLSPFEEITRFTLDVEMVLSEISQLQKGKGRDYSAQIQQLTNQLYKLCEYDIDALLGSIHISESYRYSIVHVIHSSILCFIIAKALKQPEKVLKTLMTASLTSNVGMLQLQDNLVHQKGELNEYQRTQIREHPQKSVELLQLAGIKDQKVLDIVLQHHENANGEGYPNKISADQFLLESKILGIADRYHAMISARTYRKSLLPTQALKALFTSRGKEVDEKIGLVFIKEMGIYPPGSLVRLRNGETAIVTRRGTDRMKPEVKAVLSSKGKALDVPKLRDTEDVEIAGLCNMKVRINHDPALLWDYSV